MKKVKLIVFSLIWFCMSSFQSDEIEMADGLRANGMIYVLMIIIVIMVLGLLVYLFTLDRKVTRLEKESGTDKKE